MTKPKADNDHPSLTRRAKVLMARAWKELRETVVAVAREWIEDQVPRLAAALAYYALFSLAPLLVVAIGVAGLVFGHDAARGELVTQFESLIGESGAQAVARVVAAAGPPSTSGLAALVGVVMLLIGASGVFGELQVAMNTIWDVSPRPGAGWKKFLRRRFVSFAMVLGTGFLLLISLILSAVVAATSRYLMVLAPAAETLWPTVNLLLGLALPTLLFAMIFRLVPDAEVGWRDVWLGALITAALFALGRLAIGYYLGRTALDSTYGAAASLVALVAWVYYSAQILFVGAELTQVIQERRTKRAPRPLRGAEAVRD